MFQMNWILERSLQSITSHYWQRSLSMSFSEVIKNNELKIKLCRKEDKKVIPDPSSLNFGTQFTDHMFKIEWNEKEGWSTPHIQPFENLSLHPGAKVLHYAQEIFEGMKAFKGNDNKIRLFRPEMNMKRMLKSAERAGFVSFDDTLLLECLKKLIEIDKDWVPSQKFTSLYLRPTLIGTEPALGVASSSEAMLFIIMCPVGAYFKTGIKPIALVSDPKYARAWPGGIGNCKMGANYAPTIAIQKEVEKMGFQQILWLHGSDHELTEVGAMNIFIYLINENNEKELITPSLESGMILPGVIRNSVLQLAEHWNEFKVSERVITMKEMLKALRENRLLEVFGTGTACVICPVETINFEGKNFSIPTMNHQECLNVRLLNELISIQYGERNFRDWTTIVC